MQSLNLIMLTFGNRIAGMAHSNVVALVPNHSLFLRFDRSQPEEVLWLKLHQDKQGLTGSILYFQTAF